MVSMLQRLNRRLAKSSSVFHHYTRSPLSLTYQALQRFSMNFKMMKSQMTIHYLGYLSNLVLMVALGLGLYTEWMNTKNTTVLLISMLGMLVFGVSCAMQYYFSMESLGKALLHIWLGCILGVIIFTDQKDFQFETMQEVMDILFVSSAVCGWFWSICERFLHLKQFEPHLFSSVEALESIGLLVGSLVIGVDSVIILFCVIAFILNLTAIRMKSFLGLLTLIILFIIVSLVLLPALAIEINVYGLICYTSRYAFDPIIDLYFSGLSTLERWQALFNKNSFIRKTLVLFIFLLNLFSVALIGRLSANHKEWFVVIPIYIVFAVLWLCFHVIYFISTWKLMNKITECNATYIGIADEHKSMNRIMAAKGIRHFGLISRRLICLTLLTTVLLMGVGWETKTPYNVGLILIIIPIEAMTLSLFWELGDNLGGTCIGYAMIAPHTGQRNGGNSVAKLLSAAAVQDIGARATSVLNKIQQFFNFNMIENFGCDFSSSGLMEDYLQSKVKLFFDRKTNDGPRYDTYLLYYSGDVHDSGDWALTGNGNLKLDTLLEWWAQKNADSGSRLILVLDTLHSWRWAQEVSKISEDYVAVQTCKFVRAPDPEYGQKLNVGTFTDDWVQYNIHGEVDPPWSDKDRIVRAVYKVSQVWTNFTFHLPTKEDIEEHWASNFPRFTKPLIKGVNFFGTGSLCCCDGVRQFVRRKRMHWLPPKVASTGHGFKLVRS